MHDHARAPLYPTPSHNATQIPCIAPLCQLNDRFRPKPPSAMGNDGELHATRSRNRPCSRRFCTRRCTFATVPSGTCATVARDGHGLRGSGRRWWRRVSGSAARPQAPAREPASSVREQAGRRERWPADDVAGRADEVASCAGWVCAAAATTRAVQARHHVKVAKAGRPRRPSADKTSPRC